MYLCLFCLKQYMESLKGKEKNIEKRILNDKSKSKHGSIKLFTVKLRGLAYNHKKKNVKQFFHPLKAKSIRISPKIKGIAYVGFKTEQHLRKALLKNKSFLGINDVVNCNWDLSHFPSFFCLYLFYWTF